MKKIFILLLSFAFVLASCSDGEELIPPTPLPEQPEQPSEPDEPSTPDVPSEPSEPENPDPQPEPDPETPEPDPQPDPETPEPDPETPEPGPPVPTGKSIVFARGVTLESGWYDVNKVGNGQTNGDINMCWAASSSNIIEWWQDRYREVGYALPEGAVTGVGEQYELALMEMFHSQWDNSRGAFVDQAVVWYFEGVNIRANASPGSQAQPLSSDSGGYYRDLWSDISPKLYKHNGGLYTAECNNYYEWGGGVPNLSSDERLRIFSNYVVDAIDHGIASLVIALAPNLGSLHHATTLWGYEIDNATGLVTRLWITDSDDMTTEPKHPVLHEYSVGMSSRNTVQLSGRPYGSCYVVGLMLVSGYDML